MNNFRMSLLKERAAEIRPDLDRAREITEKAHAENSSELTPEESGPRRLVRFVHRGQVPATFVQGHGRPGRCQDAARRQQGTVTLWCCRGVTMERMPRSQCIQ